MVIKLFPVHSILQHFTNSKYKIQFYLTQVSLTHISLKTKQCQVMRTPLMIHLFIFSHRLKKELVLISGDLNSGIPSLHGQ